MCDPTLYLSLSIACLSKARLEPSGLMKVYVSELMWH